MNEINYNVVNIYNKKELEKIKEQYWYDATIEERFKETMYLRECMYGEEINTRKLKRVCRITKQASGRLQDLADVEKLEKKKENDKSQKRP